jgi:hypothetical protein
MVSEVKLSALCVRKYKKGDSSQKESHMACGCAGKKAVSKKKKVVKKVASKTVAKKKKK